MTDSKNPSKIDLEHYNSAVDALDNEGYDKAIAGFDSCLSINPRPQIAMLAWFLLGKAILMKFSFWNRHSSSTSDEEYYWSLRAGECARKSIEVYERAVARAKWTSEYDAYLAQNCQTAYEDAKELSKFFMSYGPYIKNAYGDFVFRANVVFSRVNLPPLRCLAAYEARMKEVAKREQQKR